MLIVTLAISRSAKKKEDMKLTDKRFWIFEAMMLLCGFLLFCTLLFALWCKDAEFDMGTGVILILSFPVVLLYFAICGIPTWLLYKGNSWLKLAGWLYLISSLLVIVSLLIFFYDWNPITANMRPADISPDEGKYITDNELIAIVCAMWAVFLAIPVLITSFLTKRWILKDRKTRNTSTNANKIIDLECKKTFGSIAESYGFRKMYSCWIKESPECIFVLLLQKSNFGNYYDLVIKIFIQGVFGHHYTLDKNTLINDVGDVFLRQPKEYNSIFDLDQPTDVGIWREKMKNLFTDYIIPLSEATSTKSGILELHHNRKLTLLPAIEEELHRKEDKK